MPVLSLDGASPVSSVRFGCCPARYLITSCSSYHDSASGGRKSSGTVLGGHSLDDRHEVLVHEPLADLSALPDVHDPEHTTVVVEPGGVDDQAFRGDPASSSATAS